MGRYDVVFSARALESLRQVTRYIAEKTGTSRATNWLAEVRASTVTLEKVIDILADEVRWAHAEGPSQPSQHAERRFTFTAFHLGNSGLGRVQ